VIESGHIAGDYVESIKAIYWGKRLKMENKYLQELTFAKLRLVIIQKLVKWDSEVII